MRLHSYVVARDFGFAPNPFDGCCTLATCKPDIRLGAQVGDWVLGTGSARRHRTGYVVFAMRVTETLGFDDYWNDARFRGKRPMFSGSISRAYGDNIYHHVGENWAQEDSHHSLTNGIANIANVTHDTRVDRVLISDDFYYWGAAGPQLPEKFRSGPGNICALRGRRNNFPPGVSDELVAWLRSHPEGGYLGAPGDWR